MLLLLSLFLAVMIPFGRVSCFSWGTCKTRAASSACAAHLTAATPMRELLTGSKSGKTILAHSVPLLEVKDKQEENMEQENFG